MNPGIDLFWIVPVIGGAACVVALVVGRRLITPKTAEPRREVELDANFLRGVTQDRRAAPRRKGNTVDVQIAIDDNQPIAGVVIDRSQGGLRILVDQAIADGTVLKVRPTTAGMTIPWTPVTVRDCARSGTQYEIGCQFHGMPNWSLMLQFG